MKSGKSPEDVVNLFCRTIQLPMEYRVELEKLIRQCFTHAQAQSDELAKLKRQLEVVVNALKDYADIEMTWCQSEKPYFTKLPFNERAKEALAQIREIEGKDV